MYLRTSMVLLYQDSEIEQAINDMYKEIMARNENNLEIVNIFYLTIMVSRFKPLCASHFHELPPFLESKRAIVNVQNRDQKCFAYGILSSLHSLAANPHRTKKYQDFFKLMNEINCNIQ